MEHLNECKEPGQASGTARGGEVQGPGLEEEVVQPGRAGRRGDQWPGLCLDATSSWHLLSADCVLGPEPLLRGWRQPVEQALLRPPFYRGEN